MATSPPETAAPEAVPAHGAAAYRRVLGAQGFVPLAVASVLARLPIGMGAIALVLYVQHEVGSFAAAGVAAAGYPGDRRAAGRLAGDREDPRQPPLRQDRRPRPRPGGRLRLPPRARRPRRRLTRGKRNCLDACRP